MTAVKIDGGKWAVSDGKAIWGTFETSAEAWRWIDRHEGEPVSRGEQTAEYVFRKMWDAP